MRRLRCVGGLPPGGGRVHREGFPVVLLESHVSFLTIAAALLRALMIFVRARWSYHDFSSDRRFRYRGVPLAGLLWPSIVYFFTAEVPQRYMLRAALMEYLRHHSPAAVKLWAGGVVYESSCLVELLRNSGRRSLFVMWVLGVIGDDPYESRYEAVDLFLASGSRHAAYLKRNGFSERRIVSVGMSRYDRLRAFRDAHSPSSSRQLLGIPATYSFHVLLDAGVVMRGYCSRQEQIEALEVVLQFAKDHPAVAALIKPHPSHHHGMLDDLIDSYALENVFRISKNSLPYHAINAADVVLTKYSTIGLEAMLFERPVISLILDGEERFKIFDHAAAYVMSSRECAQLLAKLARDRACFETWRDDQARQHRLFLKGYCLDDPTPAADLAATVLDQEIRRHQSPGGVARA